MSICTLYMLTIYIWSIQKWLVRKGMCTHVAHKLHFPTNYFLVKKISVVGPVCAGGVHILCLIIHFLAVQIWFFICVKSQLAVWSGNAKVGGNLVPENCPPFSCVSYVEYMCMNFERQKSMCTQTAHSWKFVKFTLLGYVSIRNFLKNMPTSYE